MGKNTLCKKILLSIITIIVFLLILEVFLRLTYPLYANYNTEMWRYASESKQISHNPGLGHEHTINSTNMFYGAEINTNSLGLRADKEFDIPKSNGTKRILVLGDSITMGWGVNYNETYSNVLEKLLNKNSEVKYEVLNAGVGNYNSVNNLAAFKKYLYLKPDIVILGFYINDIEKITQPSKAEHWIKGNSYLYAFFSDKIINMRYRRMDYTKHYSNLYADDLLRIHLNKILTEMIKLANNNSIPFVFVNIPELHQFENYAFNNINAFIEKEIIRDLDVIYVDLLEAFRNETPEDLWVSSIDPHPNAKGHKIIALNIYQKMKDL